MVSIVSIVSIVLLQVAAPLDAQLRWINVGATSDEQSFILLQSAVRQKELGKHIGIAFMSILLL